MDRMHLRIYRKYGDTYISCPTLVIVESGWSESLPRLRRCMDTCLGRQHAGGNTDQVELPKWGEGKWGSQAAGAD